MRQLLLITGSAMLAFGAVFGLFTLQQANQEQITLQARLQSRTQVLADSLAETIEPALAVDATSSVQRIADRFSDNQRLAGLEVFDSSATPIVWSADVPVSPSAKLVPTAMDSDEAQGEFVRDGESTFYVFVSPLHQGDRIIGALVLVQSASYIDDSVWSIWVAGIGRLLAQLVLFGAAVFILLRWVFFKPLSALMVSLRSIRKGEVHPGSVRGAGGFLHPLESEVSKITSSLAQARRSASEEARMRLEKIDTPWTAERLKEFIKAYVKDRPIYALSNREPYVHHTTKNGPAWSMPAGGAVTALDPVLEATGGTFWYKTTISRSCRRSSKRAVPTRRSPYSGTFRGHRPRNFPSAHGARRYSRACSAPTSLDCTRSNSAIISSTRSEAKSNRASTSNISRYSARSTAPS